MNGATPGAARRGQPLLALALVLGGWTAMRILTWQAMPRREGAAIAARDDAGSRPEARAGERLAPSSAPGKARVPERACTRRVAGGTPRPAMGRLPGGGNIRAGAGGDVERSVSALPPPAAGAAIASLPAIGEEGQPSASRWSGDGWMLWRRGSAGSAAGLPAYGASQAGFVLRYRLAAARGPHVFLRAATALVGTGGNKADADLALGLGARPLPRVPLRVLAEMRADRLGDGRLHGRAAVIAVSEFPPLALPGGTRGELYVQAGYVAGPAGTAFADGAARVERQVAEIGPVRLSGGGGLSGGAQRGAGRLDIGPAVVVGLSRDGVAARAAFEWRFRVAGDARPDSGPALTVTAGF